MALKWTEELTAQVVETYEASDPTPENTVELCKTIADEVGATVNAVRMVLSNRGVYVTKAPGATKPAATKDADGKEKPKRVSKAAAQAELISVLAELEADVEEDIIEKLTGKAALYFTGVLRGIDVGNKQE